jgi:hypothetical protein
MKTSIFSPVLIAAAVTAQHNTSTANGCNDGFYPGTDTVIFTTPYTYTQVLSIIGDYQNITWSGSPFDTVTLNGTDNTVGTARTYDLQGAHIVETITTYSKPANGPYEEIHALDLITLPAANLSAYSDYDGTTATPVCNGLATTFNFTINFCATNATLAAGILHQIHLTDAQTVGVFLGGKNFSSCAALTNGTPTTPVTPPIVTVSGASALMASVSTIIMGTAFAVWLGM